MVPPATKPKGGNLRWSVTLGGGTFRKCTGSTPDTGERETRMEYTEASHDHLYTSNQRHPHPLQVYKKQNSSPWHQLSQATNLQGIQDPPKEDEVYILTSHSQLRYHLTSLRPFRSNKTQDHAWVSGIQRGYIYCFLVLHKEHNFGSQKSQKTRPVIMPCLTTHATSPPEHAKLPASPPRHPHGFI